MLYYNQTPQAVLKELNATEAGLPPTEVEERRRLYGLNTVRVQADSWWSKLIEPFKSIFMAVLFVAAIISFWHQEKLDGILILVIIAINATIYYVQRISTERVLRSLQKHTIQMVDVRRDDKVLSVDSIQLVPGDIISLAEGERVPADARIIGGSNIRVDESLLTGESTPISKQIAEIYGRKEVYEQSPMLFQGSFIVSGEVLAVVATIGNETEFGKLAVLSKKQEVVSPIQKKIDALVNRSIGVIAGIVVVAFFLALNQGMALTESLRFVIAIGVSAVPEDLPVAISVILVLGMRRMARKRALVRNSSAIETVGVVTAIASDKTGTLTRNKLSVQEIWRPVGGAHNLVRLAARAINNGTSKMHDPLDLAISDYVGHVHIGVDDLVASFPFDQATSSSGNLWRENGKLLLVIKGAPEPILKHSDLSARAREAAENALDYFTKQGYRVIALAQTNLTRRIDSLSEVPKANKFDFAGFLAIADELRPEAKRAIQAAERAGVAVKMITGDHFETAFHIGQELGIVETRDQVFDARKMATMSDEELTSVVEQTRVFSRVIPEDKYRILMIMKQTGVIAMTGDGVNDVPALSSAHVGFAMGSGSQMAKDAGDIVLLDDNFRHIVEAVSEGRTIFANIRRMIVYLFSTNIGEVLTALGALVMGLPAPLLPIQILWVNLVTDSALVIPLGLEPGEKTNMLHPPRSPKAPVLSKFIVSRLVVMAVAMAATVLAMYVIFDKQHGAAYANTIAFSALVVIQWSSALCVRSTYESIFKRIRVWSGAFIVGLSVAVTVQVLAMFGPLREVMHVSPVHYIDLLVTGIIAFLVPVIFSETHKLIGRRLLHKN